MKLFQMRSKGRYMTPYRPKRLKRLKRVWSVFKTISTFLFFLSPTKPIRRVSVYVCRHRRPVHKTWNVFFFFGRSYRFYQTCAGGEVIEIGFLFSNNVLHVWCELGVLSFTKGERGEEAKECIQVYLYMDFPDRWVLKILWHWPFI